MTRVKKIDILTLELILKMKHSVLISISLILTQ